jgi:hypothetical protein
VRYSKCSLGNRPGAAPSPNPNALRWRTVGMPEIPLGFPKPEPIDGSLSISMYLFMAGSTQGDQIGFGVVAAVAAKFLMVNL